MNSSDFIAIGGLIVALVGIITSFILQRDIKKIRQLERDNKKFKNRLSISLKAIKGYQLIEEEQANTLGKEASIYRREIRKNYSEYFKTEFLTPKNIVELITELESE